jgi:hypothetical protein
MQQWLVCGWPVEIAGIAPQHDVCGEERSAGDMLLELGVLIADQDVPPNRRNGQQHHRERRKNAPDSSREEVGQAEPALLELLEEKAGDQESGDDEEHVDADKAARHDAGQGVKRDNG